VHALDAVLDDAGIARLRPVVARTTGGPERVFRAVMCALLKHPKRPQHRAVRWSISWCGWRIRRRDAVDCWTWHRVSDATAIHEANAVVCRALEAIADDSALPQEVADRARRAAVEAPAQEFHGEWILDILRVWNAKLYRVEDDDEVRVRRNVPLLA
jgi:hypothetical protein